MYRIRSRETLHCFWRSGVSDVISERRRGREEEEERRRRGCCLRASMTSTSWRISGGSAWERNMMLESLFKGTFAQVNAAFVVYVEKWSHAGVICARITPPKNTRIYLLPARCYCVSRELLMRYRLWLFCSLFDRIQTRLRLCSGLDSLSLQIHISNLRLVRLKRIIEVMCVFWPAQRSWLIITAKYEGKLLSSFTGTPANKACLRDDARAPSFWG